MKKRIRFSRPSPALAIACIALFVAMGGVSYGVATGSIDSREIKNGSIRNPDFKDGTLRGNEAKPNGFGGKAIKESTLASPRWALINQAGQIERQTGGFTAVDCYRTNANCYLDIGENATIHGVWSEISASNTPVANRLNGETGTAPCGEESVNCAPPNTETDNIVVVVPRNSDGTATTAGTRYRFYVYVSGSEQGSVAAP